MRGRARLFARCLLAGLAGLLLAPAAALAHPLGNFTVNRYSRLEVGAEHIRILYVLDIAEIPGVQERQVADTDRNGTISEAEWAAYARQKAAALAVNLSLAVDGVPVPLAVESSQATTSPGQAGLPLVRLEATLDGPLPAGASQRRGTFQDRNEPTRIGWREIVVRSGPNAEITESTVPAEGISNELRSYPQDLLSSPLDRRQADFGFAVAGSVAAGGPTLAGISPAASSGPPGRPTDGFTSLAADSELTPSVMLLALLASVLFGVIHAASPGHGKTVMAAYIVGTRGTMAHAIGLALSVTVSHTLGVLAIGIVTLVASNLIFPEQLFPWLTLTSGLIVLVIGLGLVARAINGVRHSVGRGHDHSHSHAAGATQPHDHGHEHGHSHDLQLTWRNLLALGLAGGMVPSASALVVLLSALATGRLVWGLVLIIAYGAGMAVVLTATGFLLVHAGRLVARYLPERGGPWPSRFTRAVPVMSALVMTIVGAVITVQAVVQTGLIRG